MLVPEQAARIAEQDAVIAASEFDWNRSGNGLA
jgi:hypothetical protein